MRPTLLQGGKSLGTFGTTISTDLNQFSTGLIIQCTAATGT